MKKLFFLMLLSFTSMVTYAQIAEKAEDVSPLLIGETVPNEQILDLNNKSIKLHDILKKKPTVLVVYRGGWCPFCNVQLAAMAQSEEEIVKMGYQIVAISPEDVQNLQPTIAKDSINYSVYSDPNANLVQKMGLAFQTSARYKTYIAENSKGKVSPIMPVPAVMVLDTKGKILFEYINPDFKTRLSPELLLAVLSVLQQK